VLRWEDFQPLDSPDYHVRMGIRVIQNDDTGGLDVMRGAVTLDVSIEECASWEVMGMSREQTRVSGNPERSQTSYNAHSALYRDIYDLGVPGCLPREAVLRLVWKKQGLNSFRVAYESTEVSEFPHDPNFVRMVVAIDYLYEKLPDVSGVAQTRVTYTTQADVGGSVPKFVVNREAVDQLMYLSRMKRRFDKSLEIDASERSRNAALINAHTSEYSAQEDRILAEGLSSFDLIEHVKTKPVKMANSLTTAEVGLEAGSRLAWGWASTTVRATPTEVMASLWDVKCRAQTRREDLEKIIDQRVNDHNMLYYVRVKTPTMVSDREFLQRLVWKSTEKGGFVIVSHPEVTEERPQNDRHKTSSADTAGTRTVRGKFPSSFTLKKKGDHETTIEYVIHPDSGGYLPFWLLNRLMSEHLAYVTEIQERFQALRGLEEWDAADGKAVGAALMSKGNDTAELFVRFKGLKELGKKHEWIEAMLARVVKNKLRLANEVSSSCVCMSAKEGGEVGAGLAMAIATNLTAEAGVDDWIRRYKCLAELDREEVWFRSLMNEVAQRLLGEVSWGLKLRVIIGAGLSVLDIASDVFVMVSYYSEGRDVYGRTMLIMLCTTFAFQFLGIFLQNKTRPLKLARETLLLLCGLKPAVDAKRVAEGQKQEEHHAFDAKTERMVDILCEMIFESIPGCLVQILALLRVDREKWALSAMGSIGISALTTGYTSACLSFDFDVDPVERKR